MVVAFAFGLHRQADRQADRQAGPPMSRDCPLLMCFFSPSPSLYFPTGRMRTITDNQTQVSKLQGGQVRNIDQNPLHKSVSIVNVNYLKNEE